MFAQTTIMRNNSASVSQKCRRKNNKQYAFWLLAKGICWQICGTSTINLNPTTASSPVTIIAPSKQLNGMASATTVATNAPTKNGCERRWKSKNGERLRDHNGYRLRAAGVCVRRNAVNGQLEMLLVSAQRGLNSWVIPGGGIEIGEEMHEAVLREVEEEAGVRAIVTELIGEFQDDERLHRTALYLLSPLEELEEWEDGMNGRLRQWLSYADALETVKITQRTMLEITASRIADIEKTALSTR
ncbi:Nudix hydrolase domain-containing protein [Aphelenchoides bicaudatus]|nr:Nudix hydrolase domain-containing protein [Aphelenchoides bicaudatus]